MYVALYSLGVKGGTPRPRTITREAKLWKSYITGRNLQYSCWVLKRQYRHTKNERKMTGLTWDMKAIKIIATISHWLLELDGWFLLWSSLALFSTKLQRLHTFLNDGRLSSVNNYRYAFITVCTLPCATLKMLLSKPVHKVTYVCNVALLTYKLREQLLCLAS